MFCFEVCFFFPTLRNNFWVLSSPCALKADGTCGPASSSWNLLQHPSCPGARHIPLVLQGLGCSQPSRTTVFF